jgi:hypothetical protein
MMLSSRVLSHWCLSQNCIRAACRSALSVDFHSVCFSIDARYPNILYVALRRSTRGPRVFVIINYFRSTPTSLGSVQTYNSFHTFTLLT